MSRIRTKGVLSAMPFLFALSACGGMSSSTPDPFLDGGRNEIRIHVRNSNFYDARISALLEGGPRRQLGSVGGKTDAILTLPVDYPRVLRLEIDLLAGPTCVTEPITVDPGDDLQLDILGEPLGGDFCR